MSRMSRRVAISKPKGADREKAPAIVAAIATPAMAVCGRHEFELDAWEVSWTDAGDVEQREMRPPRAPRKHDKLIPVSECRAIIAEVDAALRLAPYHEARALARTVMGRYSKRDLFDPGIFVFELTRVFGEAPADLGREAADQLRTARFLPNTADVKILLDGLVRERSWKRGQAKAHLAEHERRRAEAAKPEPEQVTPEQAAAILEASGMRKMMDEVGEKPVTKAEPRGPSGAFQLDMQGALGNADAVRAVVEKHLGVKPPEPGPPTEERGAEASGG